MNKFSLLPILRSLTDSKAIRKLMTLVMQACAVASLVIGVYFVVTFIRAMTQTGAATEGIICAILAILILSAMCLALAQIFWLRAGNVRDLPETPYALLPMGSLFIRAGGEATAAAYAAIGLVGCLFQWIAKANPFEAAGPSFVPAITDQNAFLGGLLFLLRCWLGSGLAVLIGYFLAEAVLLFVDIMVHIRMAAGQSPTAVSPLVGIPRFPEPAPVPQPYPAQYPGAGPQYPGQPYPPSPYPAPQYPGPAPEYQPNPQHQAQQYVPQQTPSAAPKCQTCGAAVSPGAPYCGRCGNPVGGRPPGY